LVDYASTHPKIFSSANGSRPFTGGINHMIDMDNPAHIKRRGLVSKGFTPRRIAEHEPRLRQICDDIIDTICERGSAEFIREVAAQLPLIVIADMLGILPEDRSIVLQWSEDLIGPEPADGQVSTRGMDAMAAYNDYASEVVAERRRNPGDDLISILVNAEIDGERLSDDDVIGETLLILIGGDETTRHTLSGGYEQLLRHPEQRTSLQGDPALMSTAIEEMLRWTSPVKNMCRLVTADVEFHGAPLIEGEKVMLLFESANFDPAVFDRPEEFSIERKPNNHIAFGFGTHFCLGNQLARRELTTMTSKLLERIPDMALKSDGPLPLRPANFVSGPESMPVTYSPVRRALA
jgi:cholest-4-en-3-one 26-monooxygenase